MNIPDINNLKWQELIASHEELELKSLAFQMTLIRTREQYSSGEIDMEKAVNLLYNFCIANQNGSNLLKDIKNYFGEDKINFVIEKSEIKEKPIEVSKDIIIHENKNLSNNTSNTTLEKIDSNEKIESEILNAFDKQNNSLNDVSLEEKEKLRIELDVLNNKVKDVKKEKGFFKRLFS